MKNNLTNLIPEQVKEIPWGWTSRTDIDGMKYVIDHPGEVTMPDLLSYFNWDRWHLRNGPDRDGLLTHFTCTTNMKSIFTTYQRFVGFEEAVVEMNQDDLAAITLEFCRWNAALLEKAPDFIDYFIVGDDLASQRAPFVKPETYEAKYIPFARELFSLAEGINGVFHSCGDIYQLLDLLSTLPITHIHFQKVGRMRKFNTGDMVRNGDKYITLWENKDPFLSTKAEGKVQ